MQMATLYLAFCKVSVGLTCAVSLVPIEPSYSLLLALYVDILGFFKKIIVWLCVVYICGYVGVRGHL